MFLKAVDSWAANRYWKLLIFFNVYLNLVHNYLHAKFQVAGFKNDWVMTILVFLTAVDSCKQLLTACKNFVFMCICVRFISIHMQKFKLLALKITELWQFLCFWQLLTAASRWWQLVNFLCLCIFEFGLCLFTCKISSC